MGDGFYRSKDTTNSIKVLKEKGTKEKIRKRKQQNTHIHCIYRHNKHNEHMWRDYVEGRVVDDDWQNAGDAVRQHLR